MQTKTLLATTLVVPLLLLACDRAEQSPTAAAPSDEKQAMAPSAQDKMIESSPPATGSGSGPQSEPSAPVSEPSSTTSTPPSNTASEAPANTGQSEPNKAGGY